jgi:alpha-acetolactate decarboxylase
LKRRNPFQRNNHRSALRIQGLMCVLLAAIVTCKGTDTPDQFTDYELSPSEIQIYGSLRGMMHEGKTGTEVALDTLVPNGTLFGVGALSELRGEVTIINGQIFFSYPDGPESVRMEQSLKSSETAALLVTAAVDYWISSELESPVDFEHLDDAVAHAAQIAGLDTSGIIPFLIRGNVEELTWHVIDGTRLTAEDQTHESHQRAAVTKTIRESPVSIVGFYSNHHQGVFTHRDSRTHMHVVSRDLAASGHVDHVRLPAGTIIQFPQSKPDELTQTAIQFNRHVTQARYDSARMLMAEDPKRWFEMRDGAGGPWKVGPDGGGTWKVWDDSMHSQKVELSWHRGDQSITVRVRETNDYFKALERGWITVDRSYFVNEDGKIEGLVISNVYARLPGRTNEFLEWARATHPDELEYLMPDGVIDPGEDRPGRYKTLLRVWRAQSDLKPVLQ